MNKFFLFSLIFVVSPIYPAHTSGAKKSSPNKVFTWDRPPSALPNSNTAITLPPQPSQNTPGEYITPEEYLELIEAEKQLKAYPVMKNSETLKDIRRKLLLELHTKK